MSEDYRLTMILEYLLYEQARLEDAYIQMENNIGLRGADYVDHLEIILAKCRIDTALDISTDIRSILRYNRDKGGGKGKEAGKG